MKIEDLDKVLAHPNIHLREAVERPGEFNRDRIFTINGNEYHIEWWCNACYLHIGGVIVPFDSVRRSNTWPIMSKLNLQFYNRHGGVCCVIPDIEQYPVASSYADACALAEAATTEEVTK